MLINHRNGILILAIVAPQLLSRTTLANAEGMGMIEIEFRSAHSENYYFRTTGSGDSSNGTEKMMPVHMATAKVTMNAVDLMNLTSLMFTGMKQNGEDQVNFTKMNSGTRLANNGTNEVVWHGSLTDGRLGFATFIHGSDGYLTGSFTTETTAYSLDTMPDGTIQVRATLWEDLPDPVAFEKPNTRRLLNHTNITLSKEFSAVPHVSGEKFALEGYPAVRSKVPDGRFLRGQERMLQGNVIADVLVIVTNRAMCEYAGLSVGCEANTNNRGPIERMIMLLDDEANTAMQTVGAAVGIRIVDIVFLAAGYDGLAVQSTLETISDDPNIQQWRQEAGADLVAMITGAGTNCGIAFLNSHESATSHTCLDGYTFTHELGHNFGCLHNREDSASMHPYGHGWRYQSEFRTVMAYNCASGCQRIPYFSANGFVLQDGRPIGDPSHDNARLLRENAAAVANFMQSQQLSDWVFCTSSSQCQNGCCSSTYSDDGMLKCTPLSGGFRADICIQP